MGSVSERNFDPKNFGNGMGMGMMKGHGGNGISKADLIGSVSAVNAEKSIVTVKDADGKETQVHVNPFTRIRERLTPDGNKTNRRNLNRDDNILALSDLKAGDYVAVTKFDSETKTIEASKIIVAEKK